MAVGAPAHGLRVAEGLVRWRSGEPVANAVVRVLSAGEVLEEGRAGSDGTFALRLSVTTRTGLEVEASAPGGERARGRLADHEPAVLVLRSGTGRISGRVLGREPGQDLVCVAVDRFGGEGEIDRRSPAEPVAPPVVAPDGTFTAPALAGGRYRVAAWRRDTRRDRPPTWTEDFPLRVAAGSACEVTLAPGTEVVVELRAPRPREVSFALAAPPSGVAGEVQLVAASERVMAAGSLGPGEQRILDAEGLSDRLRLVASEYEPLEVPLGAGDHDLQLGSLRLEPARGRLEGSIGAPDGPAAGALVELRRVDGGERHQARADASGAYAFDRLGAGRWVVSVTASGRSTDRTVLLGRGETARCDLRLEPQGLLDLTVTITGPGQPSAVVAAVPEDDPCLAMFGTRGLQFLIEARSAPPGPGGIVRLQGLGPGRYTVVAIAAGAQTRLAGVMAGGHVALRPGAGAEVRGTITRGGRPVALEEVWLADERLRVGRSEAAVFRTRTDVDGRYRLEAVPPGAYRLVVGAVLGGDGDPTWPLFRVRDLDGAVPLEVDLARLPTPGGSQ